MRSIFNFLTCYALVAISHAIKTTTKVCPLLGPAFPIPTDLGSNQHFQRAVKKLEATLNASLTTGISPDNGPAPFNQSTISFGIFSTTEKDLIYQFHYTDPSVRNSSVGTRNVDADSIYRLGSISKALSVYIFLIRDGDVHWNDPITKHIPELAAAAANATASPNGITPNWDEITIGQLASHLSGLPRDFGSTDISYPWVSNPGLPPIPGNQIPNCNYLLANGTFIPCTFEQYLTGSLTEPALFQSGSTPIYSNNAFVLLSIALENITGDKFGKIFNESLVEALDLSGTSFDVPSSYQNGVIPGDPTSAGWDTHMEAFSATGAFFSSVNDVATIGRSILNSTILSKAQTRRWLKPATFTADVNTAVGYPWEIYRTQTSGRVVDLYTKNGGQGAYSTELVLVPDYDFGFVILTASALGQDAAVIVYLLTEMITSEVIPVLEEVARDQAMATFAGNYAASHINSSLTITVDDQPGLRVTQWVSNGTNFFDDVRLSGDAGTYVDFRLQPNQLYTGNQVGFTGIYQTLPAQISSGPLDINCVSWITTDSVIFGNIGIEEFVFDIDSTTGKATSVQPKALRIVLEKQR